MALERFRNRNDCRTCCRNHNLHIALGSNRALFYSQDHCQAIQQTEGRHRDEAGGGRLTL